MPGHWPWLRIQESLTEHGEKVRNNYEPAVSSAPAHKTEVSCQTIANYPAMSFVNSLINKNKAEINQSVKLEDQLVKLPLLVFNFGRCVEL